MFFEHFLSFPLFAWLYWNPSREAFFVPWINRPVMWYGICFVFGFLVGYFLFIALFTQKLLSLPEWASSPKTTSEKKHSQVRSLSYHFADKLLWFIVIGTIVGARLGEVFFYEWPYYKEHPLAIFKVWEGGLASHGGAIGVLVALFLFHRLLKCTYPSFSYIALLDIIAIPTAFVAFCIRVGNFINQEIIGPPTDLPWGIIFAHPIDGSSPVPRHPTQLYEALAYLFLFICLFFLWKKKGTLLLPGRLTGIFFLVLFTFRFLIEFLKLPQSAVIDESFLQMGQYLSLPFIAVGLWLLAYPRKAQQKKITVDNKAIF